jgi:hypothetical protein
MNNENKRLGMSEFGNCCQLIKMPPGSDVLGAAAGGGIR